MSIVDKLIYRYERLDGDIDELVPASLARELERHCEAMANSFDRRVPPESARAYEKWKQERGQK